VIKKYGSLPTLLELKQRTGKTLTVAAANVNKKKIEYFNYLSRPNLGAVDAVKMSCNLPFVFQRIIYNSSSYADGGLVDNFPIEGLLDKSGKILACVVTCSEKDEDPKSIFDYLYWIITMPINTTTKLRIKLHTGCNESGEEKVKVIYTEIDISPINFAIPSSKKMEMFLRGYRDAKIEDRKERLVMKGWACDEADFDGWESDFDTSLL